jgi:hypothetical protein
VKIEAKNLSAQLLHRARGNPPSTLANSAISNCFPGLEFDFRNIWRRLFVGIELHEADNLVVAVEPRSPFKDLLHHRLLKVADQPTVVQVTGPLDPGGRKANLGVTTLEWSNSMAAIVHKYAGRKTRVKCEFTARKAMNPVGPNSEAKRKVVYLRVRSLFAKSSSGSTIPVLDAEAVLPGELTQSLCSPWQNDYRECACYYWASSRPDYVNVEFDDDGVSTGNNWLSLKREPKKYFINTGDTALITYAGLFREWQSRLRFIVGGRDAD